MVAFLVCTLVSIASATTGDTGPADTGQPADTGTDDTGDTDVIVFDTGPVGVATDTAVTVDTSDTGTPPEDTETDPPVDDTGSPQDTGTGPSGPPSAAEIAGETGGFACATVEVGGWLSGALVLGLVFARRR